MKTLFSFVASAISILALSSSAEAAGSASVRDDPFCKTMLALVKAGANDFADYKGAYLTDREKWVATLRLPNARSCTIADASGFGSKRRTATLSCRWDAADNASAVNTATTIERQIRQCLYQGYGFVAGRNQREAPDPARGLFDSTVMYEPDGDGADFRVSTFASKAGGGAAIYMEITPTNVRSSDFEDFDPHIGQ